MTGVYHIPLALQCIYRRSNERDKNKDGEEGREWRLTGLLYVDDLVFSGDILWMCVDV